jgi:uncharacterized protein with FMN-binding domain
MPSDRLHRGLVAVSASAVAAIYLAGYLRTQLADASIGTVAVPTAVIQPTGAVAALATATAAVATPTPRIEPFVLRQATPTPRTVPTAPPARIVPEPALAALKDGTYAGQGLSRRGDVWVSVQVLSGRIAKVTITRSTLQYPLRDIAGLPSQVVQRQSAQVDIVSRATYSSEAFQDAVAEALSQAG